jgi:hypothetical protein
MKPKRGKKVLSRDDAACKNKMDKFMPSSANKPWGYLHWLFVFDSINIYNLVVTGHDLEKKLQ